MVFCAQVLAHALYPVFVDPPLLQGKVWGEDAPLLVTQVGHLQVGGQFFHTPAQLVGDPVYVIDLPGSAGKAEPLAAVTTGLVSFPQ